MSANFTVRVPLAIRRRPGRKKVVTPEGKAGLSGSAPTIPTRADPALLKALARAFRYQRLLEEGQYASITEMAEAEKLDRGYMGRLLQLTLLAPSLVEAVLDGQYFEQLDLTPLLKAIPFGWEQQAGYAPRAGVAHHAEVRLGPLCAHLGHRPGTPDVPKADAELPTSADREGRDADIPPCPSVVQAQPWSRHPQGA